MLKLDGVVMQVRVRLGLLERLVRFVNLTHGEMDK